MGDSRKSGVFNSEPRASASGSADSLLRGRRARRIFLRRVFPPERQHIWNNADFRGELERIFPGPRINQLNEGSCEAFRRLLNFGLVDARLRLLERRRLVGLTNGVHSKIARLGIGGLPTT